MPMIVEVDIVVNHFICFIKGSRFVSADTFGFQNEEEEFCINDNGDSWRHTVCHRNVHVPDRGMGRIRSGDRCSRGRIGRAFGDGDRSAENGRQESGRA